MTYAQIGEAIGSAGSTVGDLASGRSQSPRAASALALLRLHGLRCAREQCPGGPSPEAPGVEIDVRMSKRALRARLGFANDKQLATVLGLPLAEVESWDEERALPAAPEVLRLLGGQPQVQAEPPAVDPDDDRIVPVEVA